MKKSSAQVTAHYAPADLEGRQVLGVVNFPPRQIGTFMSEALVLGVPDADGEVVLIAPDLRRARRRQALLNRAAFGAGHAPITQTGHRFPRASAAGTG